jgi:hypothetical protein
MLLGSGTLSVPAVGDAFSWACDPSGHASAAVQMITAAARHASSVVQHVLPVLRTHSAQQADKELQRILTVMQSVLPAAVTLASVLSDAWSYRQAGGALQHLLLSPDMLPFVTLVLVGLTASIQRRSAAGSHGVKDSSGGSSSSGSTGRLHRQQQRAADTNSSSSTAAASVAQDMALTPCQLQLLQSMGFVPEVMAWMEPIASTACEAFFRLHLALNLYSACYDAIRTHLVCENPSIGSGTRLITDQSQRWAPEQKQWLLLQSVLVPCAHDLLSCSAQVPFQQQQQGPAACAEYLLRVCSSAQHASGLLCTGMRIPAGLAAEIPAGLTEELLDALVQVAGRLVLVPGAAGGNFAPIGSSSSSSSCTESEVAARAACAGHLLPLLRAVSWTTAEQYQRELTSRQQGNSAANTTTASVPPAAARFVQCGAAIETALRVVTAGRQNGVARLDQVHVGVTTLCAAVFLRHQALYRSNFNCVMLQHIGLCGPAALAQELRQLYSLLSTVLKLGRRGAGQLCWGEQAAGSCCLAAAQAAVSLLTLGRPAGPGQPANAATAAAAVQQPAVDYLPSLVLFGRCCLQWAEQLQQQAPRLLLLAPGMSQQERELRDSLLYAHSVANVCIPQWRREAATLPGEKIEALVKMVLDWVGGLESAACLEQLAAAGCSPQQLQQQFDMLLAAQQGTQEGLPDASLAALVQRLQVTGRMLCSIAVPHFCNNLACGNISGPTEVRLVSGRSCLCAGCLTARYCGRDCQRAAWKQHKPVCKVLAAAATAAEAAKVG